MKLLKILTNSLVAGAYAGFLYLLLVYYANPDLELHSREYLRAYPALGGFFAVFTTVLFAAGLAAGRLFWHGELAPRWASYRYILWTLAANLALLAGTYAANRWVLRLYLAPEPARLLLIATAALVGLLGAVAYLAAVGHRRARRRHRLAAALVPLAGLLLLYWLRASYLPPRDAPATVELRPGWDGPPTILVGIDSLSMDLVLPLAARGQLPWIVRASREGASGRLQGFRPARAEALWASVDTGKWPHRHHRFGGPVYRIRGIRADLRLLPVGLPVRALTGAGLVRVPGAPEPPAGPRGLFDILAGFRPDSRFIGWGDDTPARASQPGPADGPPDPRAAIPALSAPWDGPGLAQLREIAGGLAEPERDLDPVLQERLRTTLVEALREDLLTLDEALRTLSASPPFLAVRFRGLYAVSRAFLRFHLPGPFGNVPEPWVARYGGVLEGYYRFLDEVCGFLWERLPRAGRLFLVSPMGIEPLGPSGRARSRLLENGLASGGIGGAPDGAWLVLGAGVQPGVPIEDASVVDVAPTLLYSLGLPVGRDMDGRTRIDLFEPDRSRSLPVFLIPSYEGVQVHAHPEGSDAGEAP